MVVIVVELGDGFPGFTEYLDVFARDGEEDVDGGVVVFPKLFLLLLVLGEVKSGVEDIDEVTDSLRVNRGEEDREEDEPVEVREVEEFGEADKREAPGD